MKNILATIDRFGWMVVVDKWNIPSTLNQNMMLMDIKAPRSKVK
jgi:hypothetical protein